MIKGQTTINTTYT